MSDAAVHKIAWGIKQYTTWVFPGNSVVKNLPAMQEMRGQEDPLEKEMATHSSILFFFLLHNPHLRKPMDRGAWQAI